MNYQPTYLGEISLDEETLAHYGVKGMRWRHHIKAIRSKVKAARRRLGLQKWKSPEQLDKEYANWEPNTKEERMAYVTSRGLQDRANRRASSRYDIGSGGYTSGSGRLITINPEESDSYRRTKKKYTASRKINKR